MTTGSYAGLLRTPGAAAFSLSAFVGRMPISMLSIGALLLVADRRGSYAVAGAAAAAVPLGLAVLGPALSRTIDRYGQGLVLPIAAVVHTIALVSFLLLTEAGAPVAALLVACVATGGALPPLGACVRARWGALLARLGRSAETPTAFAFESVLDELVFILGPVIVVAAAQATDPVVGLLLSLGLGLAGSLTLATLRGTAPPPQTAGERAGPSAIRHAGLRVVVAALLGVGLVFGGVEVLMVAFAEERDSGSGAGALLACVAAGSAVAGLAYGARPWRSSLDRRFRTALLLLALGSVPLLLAPSVLLMAPAALLTGIAVSPTLIAAFGVTERLLPAGSLTEGFTWLTSGLGLGAATGAALAGVLADHAGARPGFLICTGGALLALLVATTGRGSYRIGAPEPARTS
ncbi:MAG: major facilitator superfamily 1 [Frankiales bacterium]|nr:major facilitator superfamily 1 [Frankiales bacterium]